MTRSTRYPRCMTLRLDPRMDDDLDDLAYDLRLSRAGTIRRILRRAIAEAQEHELADQYRQVQGGGL